MNAAQTGIAIREGGITHNGEVDRLLEPLAAVHAALHVHGVSAVADELTNREFAITERNDTEIALVERPEIAATNCIHPGAYSGGLFLPPAITQR